MTYGWQRRGNSCNLLIFAAMKFGIKDIGIVSFIGLLTGRYISRIGKYMLDKLPFADYIMATTGAIAALFIIILIRPLLKQQSSD